MIPHLETLSLQEACEALGCGKTRLFQLIGAGVLVRAPRYGRRVRILADSVRRALTPPPSPERRTRTPRGQRTTRADVAAYL